MTTNYLQAADDALRLLKGFAAIKEVAEAFSEVGQLQQSAVEAQATLDSLRPQIAQALTDKANAEAATAEAKAKAKRVVAFETQAADGTRASAYAGAAAIRQEADEYAAQATAQALATITEADDALTAKRAELYALSQEASDIEARIERAKAKMQELLGA